MALPDNYRDAENSRRCGNCGFATDKQGDQFYCLKWDAKVLAGKVCNAWRPIRRVTIRHTRHG